MNIICVDNKRKITSYKGQHKTKTYYIKLKLTQNVIENMK